MKNSVVHFPLQGPFSIGKTTPFEATRGIWQLNEQKEEEEESGTPQHFVEADMGFLRRVSKLGRDFLA